MNKDMKPTTTNNDHQTSKSAVADRVFSQIKTESVTPRSKYVFWCQNSSLWLMWLFTVLLGGLATAVLIFTSTYRYYDIYEAMHDNAITLFFEALPVLWILAFAVLIFAAFRGLRATRRGYRLSPWVIGGSSVGMSVFLGFVCSALGFGFVVDKTLGELAPMYYSQAEREIQMWQQPGDGRLIGISKDQQQPEQPEVAFVDSVGTHWSMNISELRMKDRQLLGSAEQVRVLGKQLEGDSARFHACGVFPWILDKKRPMKELSAGRKEYVDKMYAHMDGPTDRLREFEGKAFGEASASNTPSMKICAEIAAVKRIEARMR